MKTIEKTKTKLLMVVLVKFEKARYRLVKKNGK